MNKRSPKLERHRDLGQAVEAGAMGAALSGLPKSHWPKMNPCAAALVLVAGAPNSVAGGCAARVADRLHVNGAIATHQPLTTPLAAPSVGGRVGFSFPLGKLNKPNQEIAKLIAPINRPWPS